MSLSEEPEVSTQQVRSSSRERSLTEKGQEMHDQEAKKNEKAFNKAYNSWKEKAREARTTLKSFCSQEDLDYIETEIQARQHIISQHYEPIQRNCAATADIVQRMDACITITTEICDIVCKRLETLGEDFNGHLEKERVRMGLNKDEYESVFGGTNTETVTSQGSDNHSNATSKASSKRADAEAELAAKQEQAKSMHEIHTQQARLHKLETEMQEEKKRLQLLEAEKEVRVAAARVKAYNSFEDDSKHWNEEIDHTTYSVPRNTESKPKLNPEAKLFRHPLPHTETPVNRETGSLTQALISSLSMNRLPAPEPTTFTGEPLKFIDWRMSFMALIDRQPLPASEKMFYLKNYLGGEARKAVEGFFYRTSEDAYRGALKVLQERYGNPFIVQRAFRDKLMKWPKVSANDPLALREFADFLQGCVEAMPHVKGLAILNDCEENHKLLKKLPEWIVRKWSRVVVRELDASENYPSLSCFTKFIQMEARIACNPIASPFLISHKPIEERSPKRARALNTSAHKKNSTSEIQETSNSKPKPPCPICKDETHGVANCPTYAAKTMEDKKAFIRENHLCFGCLRKGHSSKDCRSRHTCSTCNRRHPTCLHEERDKRPVEAPKKQSTSTDDNASQEIRVTSNAVMQRTFGTSSIVPVFMSSTEEPQREVLTYALLDTQSDSTFILEDLLEELNVDTEPVQLKLSTMTAVDTVIASKSVCSLQVRGLHSEKQIQLRQAYTRDFIPVDKSYIPTKKTALQWPHLKHLANKLPPLQSCEVGLLIGNDCPLALAPLEVITGSENDPFAQRTELGWSIVGSSNPHLDRQGNQRFVHRVAVKEIPAPSTTDVLRVLESDFNEKRYEDKDKYVSQDDVRFVQLLSDNIKQKEDGHYEMPLPFKSSSPPSLPNNKRLAAVRLQYLKKRLKANEQYSVQYKAFMDEMIIKGDAEPAPETPEGQTVWYIPHHGVYHPKKPEKLRVVFDCSAKFHGVSLNDTLLTGPDMINSLLGVLCRFRKEAVAVICDIEKMFHQFFVPPELRNYLRFLWWEGGDLEREPQVYQMAVHLFGAVSSPGCANFGLKNLARQHKDDYPSASAFVEKNFYVDDGLTSVPSIEEAKKLIAEAQELCKRGGLRLHKFNSNKKDALDSVDPLERAATVPLNLGLNATPAERALGIQWSLEQDTFNFCVDLQNKPSTRRGILSVIASLYDPLGFVAPFTLSGKCILQELCRRGIGWDDPLPENLSPRWEEWKNGLQKLKEVVIPRCYRPHNFGKSVTTELHHFSDASTVGYGTCSYLRCKNDKGEVHCSLVMAKARVAPTKLTSIPRLELSAAVVSARLSVMLKNELEMQMDEEFFWTDSQVVLAYINNEARRFHVFVANRVQLIREHTDPNQWYYIDTMQNPADHASRGLLASDISSSNWLSGPKFLWEQEIHPKSQISTELLVGDPEVKVVQVFATIREPSQPSILSRLSRFSSWTRLLKVVARIKRLKSEQEHPSELVTVEERERAAEVLIKLVQGEVFSQEMKILQRGDSLPCSSPLFHLDPILDKGILRVGGRLKQSSLSLELKHPVILPKEGHITRLILTHHHGKICHQGRGQTLMELRANGFWVLGGSKSIAKLINGCVRCRKLRRPVEEQRMAELPKERVEVSAPFTYCGMDCFGPFLTKKARKEQKRYGLIFTCLSSRAIHIEMLEDLSTDAFINALRCFISLRGAVRQLHCDQGTNFVGARNELREALKQCDAKTLEVFLAEKQCEFHFNAPSASHAGGVWERQIRTVRNVLNATLTQCPGRLDDSSLRTMFYEAMAIVNSRPLTVDGLNDPMSLEPITPNHLILMKSKIALPPPGEFVKEDVYANKRWRRVQYLIEQFWSRWKREYLLNISTRQKWHTPRRNLKVDDLVIIKEDTLPRNQWHLGRVIETTEESDGLVRRVKVLVGERTSARKQDHPSKPSIIERPIQKLVLLLESE